MKIRKSISRVLTMIAGILALVGMFNIFGLAGALQLDIISCSQCFIKTFKATAFIFSALGVALIKDSFDRKYIKNFYKNRKYN
jgi:hypothetical protein